MVCLLFDRRKQWLNYIREKMKKVLIMVLSSQYMPYDKMVNTSLRTWDSIEVEGVETIFYFGLPKQDNVGEFIYFPIVEHYNSIGLKTLEAFEWALKNKEFDYIARVNSSTYVDKKELIKYIQTLQDKEVFAGLKVDASEYKETWMWGPALTFSKDVVQKLVDNKVHLDEALMEDMGLSYLANRLKIPYTQGRLCSIDKIDNGWRAMGYGSAGFEFTDFDDLKKLDNQFYYRCKQDYDRNQDEFVMNELYKVLK